MFKAGDKFLIGLMWCPTNMKEALDDKLDSIRQKRNIDGPQVHQISEEEASKFQRPTFFYSNEFFFPFQEIINTYGVPSYKEINPAVFTIVTFPFEFGLMFGDIFHGAFLFIIASVICYSNFKPGHSLHDIFQIRYLLLFMGFFSFFCGLCYNDFTSVPTNIFGDSCYELKNSTDIKYT